MESAKRVYIIGIGGESASGKSTIAEELKDRLQGFRVRVISMDRYYKKRDQRPVIEGYLDGIEYVDDNHPDALDLDCFHKDVAKVCSEGWEIILIEGIFALWDKQILPLLDLKLFVDCDSDERLIRRVKRHLSYGQDMEEITQRYVHAVQPRQREYVSPSKWKADLILNGFQMPLLAVDMLAEWIKAKVRNGYME